MLPRRPRRGPRRPFHLPPALAGALVLGLAAAARTLDAQTLGRIDRERGRIMIEQVHRDLRRHFYDSTFKGVNLDSMAALTRERVDRAGSLAEMFAAIAAFPIALEDSHTLFVPPGRTAKVEYGWRMQMIGDTCFVTDVDPESDAARQGVTPGWVVLAVNGHAPTRASLWKIDYMFRVLRPQPGLRVVMRPPGGTNTQLDLAADVTAGKRILDLTRDGDILPLILDWQNESRRNRPRFMQLGNEAVLWKLNGFEQRPVEDGLKRISKFSSVVLDLRGNRGGSVQSLLRMIGGLFAEDYVVGTLTERDGSEPWIAKGGGERAFLGRVVVLVDSHSGSASEVLARALQLSGRGTVIGDVTSGAVMRSRYYPHQIGADRIVLYGTMITNADVVMSDGGRIEGRGVTPDVVMRPTGADLAARRDPVLAHAAQLVGARLEPADAWRLYEEP
jgi:carboxyl-terminal processing protease